VIGPGVSFSSGTIVAKIRAVDGTVLEEIVATTRGYVLGWRNHAIKNSHESYLGEMAIHPDDVDTH